MPFTIGGEWKPSEPQKPAGSQKPVKVRLIKRGKNIVTVILNLNKTNDELNQLASNLKKTLGCGGSLTQEGVEVQGDKVAAVKKFLLQNGIKSS